MSGDTKLLPCTCGNTDIHTHTEFADGYGIDYEVMECRNPDCRWQVRAINPEELRPSWNTRTPGPATAAMLAKSRELLDWYADPPAHVADMAKDLRIVGDLERHRAFLAEWEPRSETPPGSR